MTSAHAPLYKDNKETGMFITEALHPYNVFKERGFDVDFVSETGTYQPDWLSQQDDWLKDEDKEAWEGKTGEFREKLDGMAKAGDVDPDKVGAQGARTCTSTSTAEIWFAVTLGVQSQQDASTHITCICILTTHHTVRHLLRLSRPRLSNRLPNRAATPTPRLKSLQRRRHRISRVPRRRHLPRRRQPSDKPLHRRRQENHGLHDERRGGTGRVGDDSEMGSDDG